MNQNIKDRILYTFSGLMIGLGLAAFLYNIKTIHFAEAVTPNSQVQEVNDDSFFADEPAGFEDFFAEDPFEKMETLRERFFSDFDESSLFPNRDSLFQRPKWADRLSREGHFKINKSETDSYLIYEVVLEGAGRGSSIDVNVVDQMVQVTGRKVDQSGKSNENQRFYSSSTFSQSFTLPPGLDTENVEMENTGQKVVLKFPKFKTEV